MITILQYPQEVMPVYNTIAFTVDSSNKTNCLFNYICDVYLGATFITRLKLFPSGTNGYATFKVNRVLEDLLSFDLQNNLYGASLFALNPNSILHYNLKFGEEYDTSAQCTAGTTIFPDLITSDSVMLFEAFNGALQKKEWLEWNFSEYLYFIDGGGNNLTKFLTTTPEKVLLKYGSQMVWNIFFDGTLDYLEVKTYGVSGLIQTVTYTNAVANVLNIDMISVGVGPENLNNSALALGTQPVIHSLVTYYTIQPFQVGPIPITANPIRIDIDNRDVKWTPHRLWWLNRLGGFDSYTLTLKDKREIQISRTEYKRIYGSYKALIPAVWDYGIEERGRTTMSVNAQEGNTYQSNYLTELEALWFEILFTSPEVYISDENIRLCYGATVDTGDGFPDPAYLPLLFESELEPIIIKSGSYEEKTKNKVKNINYIIEIDKSEAVNIQRN